MLEIKVGLTPKHFWNCSKLDCLRLLGDWTRLIGFWEGMGAAGKHRQAIKIRLCRIALGIFPARKYSCPG